MECQIKYNLRRNNLKYVALDNSFPEEERLKAVRKYFQIGLEEYKINSDNIEENKNGR